MARSSNQKLKILYIYDYLLRNTDADHPVTVNQIIDYLDSCGIAAERKSIYSDIDALCQYGLDIEKIEAGRLSGYCVISRDFELPELKLLVDSVQSSKFITHKKTDSLIRKIETLASVHEARRLNRQVYVKNRIKAMNESIYYNVDEIHSGISQNRKIRFKYFEYTVSKSRRYRKNGEYYTVSPYAMTWDDENYYLVAFDSATAQLRHYRVDKMTDISVTEDEREGQDVFATMDMGVYSRKVFGMFAGDEVSVTLRFENELIGAVIDRLGQEAFIVPDGDSHFTVSAEVAVSPQFYGWLCGFGGKAKIVSPASVAEEMKKHVADISALYE